MTSPAGERTAGRIWTAAELAERLNRQAEILRANEGGVTFSGGEPCSQAEFAAEVMDRLEGLHILLDTSGYAGEAQFRLLARRADLVYFDLKLIDPDAHRRCTGAGNGPILRNLRLLSEMNVPFVIRVPLVPGVTDTGANLESIASTIQGLPGLQAVHLLPYNPLAGAKYPAAGLAFRPGYDERQAVRIDPSPFEKAGLRVVVC
jgi:pyruvate formate lyase activating enzyme